MDNFERELREALRPQAPPTGFTARVMGRIAEEQPRQSAWRRVFAFRPIRWAVPALLCLAMIAGLEWQQREERRRIAGEKAKQEVMLALRIAGSKVHAAQQIWQRASKDDN